jgi:pimeloyl-ACP methyl ester carboxylesterase
MAGRFLGLGLAILTAGMLLASRAGAAELGAQLISSPCRDFDKGAKSDHRSCFQIDVPEDPANAAGRHIQLDGFVIAATAPNPSKAAVFVLDGGPGVRATDNMAGEGDWSELLTDHDIVVIDQRGTGTTPNIRCNGPVDDAHLSTVLAHVWPVARLKDCLAAFAGEADARLYTTVNSATDIELERQALGYDRIDLIGGSYGTRLAQAYTRLYPDKVRSMTLNGVDPPDAYIPANRARDAERVFAAVLDRCLADPACAKAFPDIRAEFGAAKRRLWSSDFWAKDTKGHPIRISPRVLAAALRFETYSADSAVKIPGQIHALAHGDVRDLTEYAVRWRKGMETQASLGLYMSITCTEALPHNDLATLRREARGTLLGRAAIEDLAAACAIWPKGDDQGELHDLSPWEGPVLMVSGGLDPATPPSGADRVARRYPNGLLVRMPDESHSATEPAWNCLQPIIIAFIKSGSASSVDASCVKSLRFPEFQ